MMRSLADQIADWRRRVDEAMDSPGYRETAERLAAEAADSAAVRAEQDRKLYLHTSGIPASLWPHLDTPRDTDALLAARRFLPELSRFLTLSGPRGRGKTFALAWSAYMMRGRFVWAADLVQAGGFDRAWWHDLEATPLLALDEMGTEYLNDLYLANLYALLDKRYAHGRKTVIATNLDAPAFRQRYGSGPLDRLLDRLLTGGEWVALPGESMRRHWTEVEP
jgi:DNA replication protein DnaC